MERKDLLLLERDQRPRDPRKDEEIITTGGALQAMTDTLGWKILYEGFIKPNIEDVRFLTAPRENLYDIRAEIKVLKDLLKFIETKVKSANEVAEKIKK